MSLAEKETTADVNVLPPDSVLKSSGKEDGS